MRQQRTFVAVLGLAALMALRAAPAIAAPSSPASASAPRIAAGGGGRAYLRLDVGRNKVWLGQSVPVTISAQFRDVEGVTLEGLPQIKSDAIFTSDMSRNPKQATQIMNGEPVLVATWTGTITPSTAGPIALSVELPVRVRFHEAVPQAVARDPEQEEDPFQGLMNVDPSDPSSIQRIFQAMQRSLPMGFDEPVVGRAHDDAFTLRANSRLDVQALPVAGQPTTFGGAVGRFDIRASLATTAARAHEPLTLTVTVKGDGDLDRIDLAGLATSADWKAYPMTAKSEPAVPGKKLTHKTFEQVLIPTHGGALTIPGLELPVFDPASGRYATAATAPITLQVDGPAATEAELATPTSAPPEIAHSAQLTPQPSPPPPPSALLDSPRTIGLRLAPVLALLLGAGLLRFGWKRDPERALHRALRRSANRGSAGAFYESARRLIVVHFANRWGVSESEVTVQALRTQLGASAEPLVDAMSTSDALRFGRRNLEPMELGTLCCSIEESLRKAA